jgi:cysteine synthase
MSAKLIYPLIMALPEQERELLLEMLGAKNQKLDLNKLLSDDHQKLIEKREMIKYLIRTQFSKFKNS